MYLRQPIPHPCALPVSPCVHPLLPYFDCYISDGRRKLQRDRQKIHVGPSLPMTKPDCKSLNPKMFVRLCALLSATLFDFIISNPSEMAVRYYCYRRCTSAACRCVTVIVVERILCARAILSTGFVCAIRSCILDSNMS